MFTDCGKVVFWALFAKKNRTANLLFVDCRKSALVMNWSSLNEQARLNAENPWLSNGLVGSIV